MTDLAATEQQLRARLAELQQHVDLLEQDLRAPLNPDFEEQASELEQDEIAAGIEAANLNEMRDIELALGRIAAGTYGECVTCGNDIAPARLAAIPAATQCISCAR